ncbi:uncharacterized protein [Nicotiana tomentosiformis]|uniref:uncharacterized protein n=1 Tax=Nicotiana tomentosiformis TaxID=4098 RepID=UPI00388C901B
MGLGVCYTCGYPGHVVRDCPMRGGTSIVQPTGSVVGSSSSVRPPREGSQAPIGRGRGRGGASSSSGPQNRIYALAGRQDQDSSPDVVTGILSVSSYDVYGLLNPGSTLSYITLLVASKLGIEPELVKPFEVSTHIRDPVIARRSLQYIFKQREMNLCQRRWLELLKDYDVDILYHPGKANVVADALIRRSMGSMSYLQPKKSRIAHDIHQLASLGVRLLDSGDAEVTFQDAATSSLVTEVKECQYEDPVLTYYRDTNPQKDKTPFEITGDGILRY